jgi:hypothetical protein
MASNLGEFTGGRAVTEIQPLAAPAAPPEDPAVAQERHAAEQQLSAIDARLAQPMTRDEAKVLRDQLTRDDGWAKRWLAGSPERVRQMNAINDIISAETTPAGDYQARQADDHLEHLRTKYDLPAEAVEHVRANRAVSAEEKYHAEQRRRELQGDPEFVKAYLSGSLREARLMKMLNIIVASPLIEAQ